MTSKPKHEWAFKPRFRRNAFGWRGSKLAVQRIDEALGEIHAVARTDVLLAAEGGVTLIEKLSPALDHVDSSTGALGAAVNAALRDLAGLIGLAPADSKLRQKWLDRLFNAYLEDQMPYLEVLGDHWGTLCGDGSVASAWVEPHLELTRASLRAQGGYSKLTAPCLSALYSAGRDAELLALLDQAHRHAWHQQQWGARALARRGDVDAAIARAELCTGINESLAAVAAFAEQALLDAGRSDEAYARYAIEANWASTNLGRYRALAKKYPQQPPERLLNDLVAATPAEPGKWFATAKTLKLYDLALQLARRSPADPKTLIRAARDHAASEPAFAVECALLALQGIVAGWGFDIEPRDLLDAVEHAIAASARLGLQSETRQRIEDLAGASGKGSKWLRETLPFSALARPEPPA